jgi:hypothetical protein
LNTAAREGAADPPDERVLRAKYFDWCSAKVAERFLELTPDEVYELSQAASLSEGGALPAFSSLEELAGLDVPGLTFRTLVERGTDVLAAELRLPTFEELSAAYEEAPSRFDAELLGLWRERL